MKRIKDADINFKVNPKRINLKNFSMRFYTVNSQLYFFIKDQDDLVSVEREATIYDDPEVIISGGTVAVDYYLPLDWSELVTLGEGVLNYRCINNIEDPFFPDFTYNQVVEDTTGYYIDSDIHVDPAQDKDIIKRLVEVEARVGVEQLEREEADTAISGAVDSEVARAISAETELSERIDAIESGTSEALDAEIERAISAETALQDAIDAEEERAIAQENAIRQDLTDETELRTSADTVILATVNDEIVRATSADTALDNKIDVESLRAIGVENAISGNLETYKATNNAALQAETTRATSAETSLGNAIEDEVTARENADAALGTRIDNISSASTAAIEAEEARAREAESGLTTAINNEVSRATSAETIIANSLNGEITRATSAETALNNQIDAEVLRATAAEAELEAKIGLVSGATELINAETARAVTVENALSGAIDSISAATSGDIATLDAKIDTVSGNVITETTRATTAEEALSGAIDTLDVRFFDDAKYEDSGNTKVISFYNGNVVKATIDCTDFLVDGMIDDVYIENGYLVIDFNTASGKQDIRIPLTDIFNPANYYTKSETSGATEIATALAQKLAITDFNTYSGAVDTLINSKASQTTVDALSGTVTGHTSDSVIHVTSSDKEKWNKVDDKADTTALTAVNDVLTAHTADSVAHITAAERTAWNAKADESAFTAHTSDSTIHLTSGNVQTQIDNSISGKANSSDVYLKTETSGATQIATALAAKQDTLIAGENITISGNVISAEGGGGGKAIEAGRGISVTTGETADTVSFNLPISADSNNNITIGSANLNNDKGKDHNFLFGSSNGVKTPANCDGRLNFLFGFNNYVGKLQGRYATQYNAVFGSSNLCYLNNSLICGNNNTTYNNSEFSSGQYNNSVSGSSTFGDSGNTLFSVGNGTSTSARHNAFEIRQNGDIYLSSGGTDIKLQDYLGGSSIEVSSAITSGDTNPVAGGAVYDRFDEVEQVTAQALNVLNGELANKLDVSAYTPVDLSNYYTKSETSGATELATAFAATQPKLSAGTGISIDANNVISATGGTGGKAIEAGRGISITTGETADTVSFNLPISAGTGTNSIRESGGSASGAYSHAEGNGSARGQYSHAEGEFTNARASHSHSEGYSTYAEASYSHAEGYYTTANNQSEHASGQYNVSSKASTTFGDSGNTLFSVGNGAYNARHNAFEVRQNGDIYLTLDGQDVKLQDQLGGSSYTAGDGIDITNDVISVTGKVSISDFNTYSGAVESRMSEDEEVTAAALVSLNESLTGKQDTLIAGTNITISGNVISAQGGGSSYTAGDGISITNNVISVTGKTNQSDFTGHTTNTSIHVTTAQTASWNGAVTNASNAVTALGGLKLVKLSQSEYNNLQNKDNSTLYVIVG